MASAGEQQALLTPPQLEPERPLEDYGAAQGPKKGQKLRLGFLKVRGVLLVNPLMLKFQLSAAIIQNRLRTSIEATGKLLLGASAEAPVQLDGMQHILRLRSRLQVSDKLFVDLGADCSLNRRALYPRTALEYRVRLLIASP